MAEQEEIPKITVAGIRITDPILSRVQTSRNHAAYAARGGIASQGIVVEETYSGPIDDLYDTNPQFFMRNGKAQLDALQELFTSLGLPRLTRIRAVLFHHHTGPMARGGVKKTQMSSWIAYDDTQSIGWYKYEGNYPGGGKQRILLGKKEYHLTHLLDTYGDFFPFRERTAPLIAMVAALNAAEGQLAIAAPYRSAVPALPNLVARLPDVLRERIVHFLRSPLQVQRVQFPLIRRMLQVAVMEELSSEDDEVAVDDAVAQRGRARGRPRGSRSRGRARVALDREAAADAADAVPVVRGRPRGRPRGSKAKPKARVIVPGDISSDDEPLIRRLQRRPVVVTATARVKVDRWFQEFLQLAPFQAEERTEENRAAYQSAFEAFIREHVGELDNMDEVVQLGRMKVNQYIQIQWSGKRKGHTKRKR